MLVVLNRDGSDGYEEDSPDQVDEELQDGEVGAEQVGHQHGRHNDGVPACMGGGIKSKICRSGASSIRIIISSEPDTERILKLENFTSWIKFRIHFYRYGLNP